MGEHKEEVRKAVSCLLGAEAMRVLDEEHAEFVAYTKAIADEHITEIRAHAESMPLDVLMGLCSERVTHISLDWADGCCRAQLGRGRQGIVGRGPNAAIALARAMLAYDDAAHEAERLAMQSKSTT